MRTDGTPRGTWTLLWPPRPWGGASGWSLVGLQGRAYLLAQGRDHAVSLFRTDGDVVEEVERFEDPTTGRLSHSPLFAAGGALWFSLLNDVLRTDGRRGGAQRALSVTVGEPELTGVTSVGGRWVLAVRRLGLVELGPQGASTVLLEHPEIIALHRAPGADVAWALLYDGHATRLAQVTGREVTVQASLPSFPQRRRTSIQTLDVGTTTFFVEERGLTVAARADGPPGLLGLDDGALLAARPGPDVELVRVERDGRITSRQTLVSSPVGQSLGTFLPLKHEDRIWSERGRDLVRLDPVTGQDAEILAGAKLLGQDESGRVFVEEQDLLQGTQLRTSIGGGDPLVRAFSSSWLEPIGWYPDARRGALVLWRHSESAAYDRPWITTATAARRLTDWDDMAGGPLDIFTGPEGIEMLMRDPAGLRVDRVNPIRGARAVVVPGFESPGGVRRLLRRADARYLLGSEHLGGGQHQLRAWRLSPGARTELPILSGPQNTYQIEVTGDLVRHGGALLRVEQDGLHALQGLGGVSEVARGPGGLFLSSATVQAGAELWFWDDDGGLDLVEAVPGPAGSHPGDLLPTEDGRLVFAATDPDLGRELFLADARTGEVRALTDLLAGPRSGVLALHLVRGDAVWFEGVDDDLRRGLFRLSLREATAPCNPSCERGARCIAGTCRAPPTQTQLDGAGCGCRGTTSPPQGLVLFVLLAAVVRTRIRG